MMRKRTDLIIACSITCPECYHVKLEKSLQYVGTEHILIHANPELSLSESYNSIVLTHLKEIEQSKYVVFLAQDILFSDKDWGKKIIGLCDKLPDLGCAGLKCRTKIQTPRTPSKEALGYEGNFPPYPIPVNACDGATIIIPSKLFLERQFDTQFPWYPVTEDYACWIHFVKKLKVYYLPVKCEDGGCTRQSKWLRQFATHLEYARQLKIDHNRLLKKWNLKRFETTTWVDGT